MAQLSAVLGKCVLSKQNCCIVGFIEDVFFDKKCRKIAYYIVRGKTNTRKEQLSCAASEDICNFSFESGQAMSADSLVLIEQVQSNEASNLQTTSINAENDVKTPILADTISVPNTSKDTDLLFAIPFKSISASKDAAILQNEIKFSLLDLDVTSLCRLLGKKVYSADGVYKGEINDIEYGERGLVSAIFTDDGNLAPEEIAGAKEVVMLKGKRTAKPKFVLPSKPEDSPATLLTETTANELIPPRIIGDYNFLLGRTLIKDLKSYSGELLARENTFVTVELVEVARRFGKLVELTLNSK